MKKVKFYCGLTFYPDTVHEVFEFDDTYTENDIQYELWQWAKENIDAWVEEIDEDE